MIRPAVPADVPVLQALVYELALYEKAPEAVTSTDADLLAALFGPAPVARCHVAEEQAQVAGFALWYPTYSTWTGKPGLWLEDLYVRPEARGRGLGRALLVELARIAVANGWPRVEWWVLDWNTSAHGFYASLGARPEDEWTVWRLSGDDLFEQGQHA